MEVKQVAVRDEKRFSLPWAAAGWTTCGFVWLLGCILGAQWQRPRPLPCWPAREALVQRAPIRPAGSICARDSLAGAFWQPIERNAELRSARIEGGLRNLHMLDDGLRGWAVGEHGAVVVTTDGGNSWSAQNSGTSEDLNSVRLAANGQHGWAVGTGGTVIATTDGGSSWSTQESKARRPYLHDLYSVHFAPGMQLGWAVGGYGTVIATTDGGGHWEEQRGAIAEDDLRFVYFEPDGLRGWAVGARGAVMATTDGGKGWRAQTSHTEDDLQSVEFAADGQHGWAAGWGDRQASVITTGNGGQDWHAQVSNILPRAVWLAPDGSHGWSVGAGGTVSATADGGKTWKPQVSGTTADLSAVYFAADGRRGWAVGDRGTVIATGDGGATWRVRAGWAAIGAGYFSPDGQRAWAVGERGRVMLTTDGGKTWSAASSLLSGPAEALISVYFSADGRRGLMVGEDGSVIATTDGGRSWGLSGAIPMTRGESLNAVYTTVDAARIWAVGGRGLLKGSTDGGKTWKAPDAPTSYDLNAVQFTPSGLRGWAVGRGGTVVATSDAGANWHGQASHTLKTLSSVDFASDGQHGWAVGEGGTVIATSNGGEEWAAQDSTTTKDLMSVGFAPDGRHGWAVGRGGVVVATTDGGTHWGPQDSGTKASLSVLHVAPDGLRVWALQEAGGAITTRDGGRTWADPELHYQRWPAPWFWVAVVPGLGMLVLALRTRSTRIPHESVADVGATDAEIRRAQDDALGFAPLARGISRFLRNEQTRAPLTLAITGDWGTGKSSLMQLLGADLKQYGYQPIWFNAWHYQKEEHLFAALLAAIRAQAAPKVWSPAGLSFRLRLLWLRSKKQWLWALVLSTASVAVGSWLAVHPTSDWDRLWTAIREHTPAAAQSEEREGAAASPEEEPYSSFLEDIEADRVESVVIEGGMIHGVRTDKTRFRTYSPESDNNTLIGTLVKAHVQITGRPRGMEPGSAVEAGRADTGEAGEVIAWLFSLAPLLGTLGAAGATVAAVLVALRRGMTAIGADPAALLAGLAQSFSLRDATEQSTLRMRFQKQFSEVTEALPRRMIIVIDDLDRCRPEAVLDIVEAVNFLTSAGDCFVIFGMATERVHAALAMAFKDIARELADAELDAAAPEPAQVPDPAEHEKEKRRAYAHDYLQKLINIEVKVPSRRDFDVYRLVTPEGREPRWLLRAQRAIAAWKLLAVVAVAVLLGLWIGLRGELQVSPAEGEAPSEAAQGTSASSSSRSAGGGGGTDVDLHPTGPTQPVSVALVHVHPAQSSRGPLYFGLLPLGIGILLLCALIVQRLRQQAILVRDSEDFRNALALWTPLVAEHRNTPRTIKRFVNWLRYMAMLQQGAEEDRTVAEQILDLLPSWLRGGARPLPGAAADPLTEPQLIALGALHEVFGPAWKTVAVPDPAAARKDPAPARQKECLALLPELIRQHRSRPGSHWPPSVREVEIFERLLAGVRMAGSSESNRAGEAGATRAAASG